jgi:hypothetical protein
VQELQALTPVRQHVGDVAVFLQAARDKPTQRRIILND